MPAKSAVFVDNGYFKKVLAKDFPTCRPVNYLTFSDLIVNGSERLRTCVYDCPPYQSDPPSEKDIALKSGFDKFKFTLNRLPRFDFRLGRLQKKMFEGKPILKKDGTPEFSQKSVDMLMGVDIARMSWGKQIDQAIIVAGDSDFVPAVMTAKDAGILTKLYYSGYVSDDLYDACSDRVLITEELLKKCLLRKSP